MTLRVGSALILAGFVLSACSATNPGVEGLTRPLAGGEGGILEGGTGESGADAAADAGSDATAQSNAFTGAGAYASQQPATTAAMFHDNNSVGITPGKGTPCLSCHGNGGNGKEFLFAGTVFQDQAGTMPAADTEVRVRGIDGTAFLSHSDADGNFWFVKGQADNLQFPAQCGGRDAAQTALMVGTIATGDCNSCHANNTDATHVP